MAATPKPTKQQLAQAKLRAASSGINMDQSAKGLRNAGKAIAVGASLLPIGRGVKVAATAAKAVKVASESAKRAKLMGKVDKMIAKEKIVTTIAKKPGSSVKVVKAQGKASNKFANQKEAERLARTAKSKTASSKDLRGSAKQDYEVSKVKVSPNVTARVPAKSNYEFAKDMSRFGKIQKQNAGPLKETKAEAKVIARALKAANKKKTR